MSISKVDITKYLGALQDSVGNTHEGLWVKWEDVSPIIDQYNLMVSEECIDMNQFSLDRERSL